MKIFSINFLQNHIALAPKRSNFAPPAYDTVSFSANRPKDIPYCIHQRNNELDLMRPVIANAISKSKNLTPEEISEQTGLDTYTVRHRLYANNEIWILYNEMQLACAIAARERYACAAKNFLPVLQTIQKSGQKLTDSEMSFYLGCSKGDIPKLLNDIPDAITLYRDVSLKKEVCPIIEKKARISRTKAAIAGAGFGDTYDYLVKRSELSLEIIRTIIDEDEKLFKKTLSKRIYPPEIYSEQEIEMQDAKLMDAMMFLLRNKTLAEIETVARKAGMPAGVAQKRINNNKALKETFKRASGGYKDEE